MRFLCALSQDVIHVFIFFLEECNGGGWRNIPFSQVFQCLFWRSVLETISKGPFKITFLGDCRIFFIDHEKNENDIFPKEGEENR